MRKYTGDDIIEYRDMPASPSRTLQDFWQYMYSDILSVSVRSSFAEFIVASALDVLNHSKTDWAPYDIEYKGWRIEVKSSAYLQSKGYYNRNGLSRINFNIAKTLAWHPITEFETTPRRHSDLYIFCVLNCRDAETVDPIKLEQWDFYIMPTYLINLKCGDRKYLSLQGLLELNPEKCSYNTLSLRIRRAICNLEAGHEKEAAELSEQIKVLEAI